MTIEMKNVLELADAALSADYTRVRRAANALARDLDKNGETSIAKELKALVRKRGVPLKASGYMESLPVDSKSRLPLVEEQTWPDTPIFLNESGWRVFSDFIADAHRIDDLSAKGLASRLGLLLSGPPGTGKSLLAGHIAAQLSRPLYVVRLDAPRRQVIVGPRESLAAHAILLRQVNWLGDEPIADDGLDLCVRVRSSGALLAARLMPGQEDSAQVLLQDGEYGVSAGQACVFYADAGPRARVLGGGFIARAEAARASPAPRPRGELARSA